MLFALNVLALKQRINYQSYDKRKFFWFCYFGSIYHHFNFFANGYLFYLFFVVKENAVQYHLNVKWCHLIWAAL